MADIKDILGVPRTGLAPPPDAAAKPKEARAKRPEGMSREAFALLDGSHPIAPAAIAGDLKKAADLKGLKERRQAAARGLVTWQWLKFANQARSDGLELEHWVKCRKDAAGKVRPAEEGDYPFAKLNKKMLVYRYDDEEWANVVPPDAEWSREETDYLLDLCELLDLRFVAIADRYAFPGGKERSCEDLKARYYAVARALMVARNGGEEPLANQVLVKHPFNAQHERDRKRALALLLARTPAQTAAESALLDAAAAIQAQRKSEHAVRKTAAPPPGAAPERGPLPTAQLLAPAEFTDEPGTGVPSLFGPDLAPLRPAKPGVYLRGAHAREAAAQQLTKAAGGARLAKLLDSTMAELGVPDAPGLPTRAVCGAWLALRAEVLAMLDLRKRLQTRQGGGDGGGTEGRGKRPGKAKRQDEGADDAGLAKRPRTAKKFADD